MTRRKRITARRFESKPIESGISKQHRVSSVNKRLWPTKSKKNDESSEAGGSAKHAKDGGGGGEDGDKKKKRSSTAFRSKARWYQTSDRLPVSKSTIKNFLKRTFEVLKNNDAFGADLEIKKLSIGEKALETVTRAYVHYVGRLLMPARAVAERDFFLEAKKERTNLKNGGGNGVVKTVKPGDLDIAFELTRHEIGPSWGRMFVRTDVKESPSANNNNNVIAPESSSSDEEVDR